MLREEIKWNASCWVANQRLDEYEQLHISQYAFRDAQRIPHIEWCHFASDISGKVSMLMVFPNLKTSFRSPEVMEKWTDGIVLPAFRKVGIDGGVLSNSFNVIKLTAEAEREETLNVNAPDTPLSAVLSKRGGMTSEDMHKLWVAIQETANANQSSGFHNLFLVATCRRPSDSTRALPIEEAWRAIAEVWDSAVDMNFVPIESVRANASVTISAQDIGGGHEPTNGEAQSYQPSIDSIWESSRKRKAAEDTVDFDKRAKQNGDGPRPILPGKLAESLNTQMWGILTQPGRSITGPAAKQQTRENEDVDMT